MKLYRNPDVMWREEEEFREKALKDLEKGENIEDAGTSVLFSSGTMLSLNILGTEIWKRCDGKTLEEIVADLVTLFDVEEDVMKKDTADFINELKEKGYIHEE